MDTLDNLPIYHELDSNEPTNPTTSSLNFRLLIASVFTDRIAYYGLRSVVLLYAISQFNISDEIALYHYSFLTLAVCLAQFLGGFLGDFLLGSTRGILLGFGICILGAMILSVDDKVTYYSGVFLIACGTGFARANTFSFIAHFSRENVVLLEKRFIAMYGFLNLGAFISAIVIGLVGEYYGYFYSFMLVLLLYVISFSLVSILSLSNKTNTAKLVLKKKNSVSNSRNIIYLILAFIASAIFWMFFEMYSMDISLPKIEYLREFELDFSLSQIFLYTSSGLTLILIVPYYFLSKYVSIYTKLAIALILIGICWALSFLVSTTGTLQIGLGSFVILALFEAIADIFITPAGLTLIAKHGPRRYYGLIFSIYSIIIYLGAQLLNLVETSDYRFLFIIAFIVLLLASIVFFFLLPHLFKSTNSEAAS